MMSRRPSRRGYSQRELAAADPTRDPSYRDPAERDALQRFYADRTHQARVQRPYQYEVADPNRNPLYRTPSDRDELYERYHDDRARQRRHGNRAREVQYEVLDPTRDPLYRTDGERDALYQRFNADRARHGNYYGEVQYEVQPPQQSRYERRSAFSAPSPPSQSSRHHQHEQQNHSYYTNDELAAADPLANVHRGSGGRNYLVGLPSIAAPHMNPTPTHRYLPPMPSPERTSSVGTPSIASSQRGYTTPQPSATRHVREVAPDSEHKSSRHGRRHHSRR